MSSHGPRIIVVGAGLVGASIAWHLAARGACVTIFEAGEPGGVATPNSFAWINSNYSFPEPYFRLRHHSMHDWHRLARDVPGLPVSLHGSIYLPAARIDLPEFVARNAAWGYRVELIDGARVRELEPNLALVADIAAHALDEGAVEPVEVAQTLVRAAVEQGAELRTRARVDHLHVTDGGVAGVVSGDETIVADDVVVATGAATAVLVSEAGFTVPLSSLPGLLAHTRPVSRLLNGLVLADGLHVRQKANGQLLAGSDYQGTELADDPAAGGEELMRRLRLAISCGEPLVLERTTTGLRPMPGDGLPIVGRVPGISGLYVAVTHSGVTLCPALGDFASREIVDGDRDRLLGPFGPERFDSAHMVRAAG